MWVALFLRTANHIFKSIAYKLINIYYKRIFSTYINDAVLESFVKSKFQYIMRLYTVPIVNVTEQLILEFSFGISSNLEFSFNMYFQL